MEYRSKSNILRGQFSLYVLFSCNQRQRSYTNLGQPALSRKSTSTANIISIVRSNTHNLQKFTSRATDEGSLPEIVQYGPYYLPLNDLTASTGVQLMFFFSSGVSKLFGAQGSPSSGSLLNLRVLVFDSSGCLS